MKITFLTPADNLSGGTRVIASHARELQAIGHEVCVVSPAPPRPAWRARVGQALTRWIDGEPLAPEPGHLARSGVRHVVLGQPRPIGPADVPDADVVVATWWETAVWMHALPPSKGAPAHLIQGYETWVPGTEAAVHAALRLPNEKVVISRTLAQEIQAVVGSTELHLVPNAVDVAQFDAPRRERGREPCVGFLYSRAAMKGTDLALTACHRLRQLVPQMRFLAFGEDAPVNELPLPQGCVYHRRPSQGVLPSLYASCDAWIFSSRRDSFGLPILEAMACRTPVVGFDIGAAPDLLAGGAGLLVEAGNVEGLVRGVVQLTQGPQDTWRLHSELSHARAHAYSWREASQRLAGVLARAAHRLAH